MNGRPSGTSGTTIGGVDERAPDGPRLEGVAGTGTDLSRLFALSDGVFAFALTFLAVTLVLPATLGSSTLPPLPRYLASLQSSFVGYVLSYFVVASWWSSHHRLFSSFVRYDALLVRLNTFFLLVISITPFLVSLLFAYGPNDFRPSSLSARLAVVIYAAVQALGGATLLGIWRHATRDHRLVAATLPESWIRATEKIQWLNVGTFVVSIGIAFASPLLAELLWIVMIFGVSRRLIPRLGRKPPAPSTADRPPLGPSR